MFVNDLPEEVDCQVALFTDDILMYQIIKCSHYTLKFQENFTALSKWADNWGMDSNVKKSKILLFYSKGELPHYSLHGHEQETVEEVKHLRVIIQPDKKFTAHIHRKLMTANQQLIIIKRVMYWAPINAKLFVYKTLSLSSRICSSCLGPKQQERYQTEQLQDQTVQFIAGINGRDGVEDAETRLGLIPLHK